MKVSLWLCLGLLVLTSCARKEGLTDEQARAALSSYAGRNFCEHSALGAVCKNAKLLSMAALTESSPTERKAGAQFGYDAPDACKTEVTATFAKAAAGGWVLKEVEGMTLCGPSEKTGAWGSPASFSQVIP